MPEVIIHIEGARDQIFDGTLVGEAIVEAHELPAGDRWTRVALWELTNGDWVAARFRPGVATIEPDEVGETKRVQPNREPAMYGGPENDEERINLMRGRVMDFLEWSWLAKQFAASLGWPATLNINPPAR